MVNQFGPELEGITELSAEQRETVSGFERSVSSMSVAEIQMLLARFVAIAPLQAINEPDVSSEWGDVEILMFGVPILVLIAVIGFYLTVKYETQSEEASIPDFEIDNINSSGNPMDDLLDF